MAALTDRQATFVLFKLMVNQPGPQWPLFIRVSCNPSILWLARYNVTFTVPQLRLRRKRRKQCLSPSRSINGYRLIVKDTWWNAEWEGGGGRYPSMNWLPRRKICNTLTLFKLRKLDKVQQPCEPVSRVSCTDLTLHLLSSLLYWKSVCGVYQSMPFFGDPLLLWNSYSIVVQYVDLNICM